MRFCRRAWVRLHRGEAFNNDLINSLAGSVSPEQHAWRSGSGDKTNLLCTS